MDYGNGLYANITGFLFYFPIGEKHLILHELHLAFGKLHFVMSIWQTALWQLVIILMKKLLSSFFIAVVMTAAASVLLCSCGGGSDNEEDVCTIAVLKGPSSMGMIKMIDSLNSLASPIECNCTSCGSSNACSESNASCSSSKQGKVLAKSCAKTDAKSSSQSNSECAKSSSQSNSERAVRGSHRTSSSKRGIGGKGTRIKFVILNEPLQVRKMMIEGSADFAILPMTTAAVLYNKGLGYKLVAVPIWGTFYLCGTKNISNWNQLMGQRIYVMAKGMTPDVLFRYLLEKEGFVPDKDVILDYSFPDHSSLTNAVLAGRADLAVLTEPFVSLATTNNKNVKVLADLNREWEGLCRIPVGETAFVGNSQYMRTHAEITEEIIEAYSKSTAWVNAHPDSASVLIAKYGILPSAEVAKAAIPRCNLKFIRAKEAKEKILAYLKVFYTMNPEIVGGKMPDADGFF